MARRVFVTLISMVALVMMSGCASKIPYQESSFDEQKAMVYVYRLETTRVDNADIDVAVNSIVLSVLYENSYLPLEIPTGTVSVYVQNHDSIKSTFENDMIELTDVKAGESHYVKVTVGKEGVLSAESIDSSKAKEEIADTGYLDDKGFKKFKLYNKNTKAKTAETKDSGYAVIRPPVEDTVAKSTPETLVPAAPAAAASSGAAVAASSGGSASERIERLYDLKSKGAITSEEYESLKAKILTE